MMKKAMNVYDFCCKKATKISMKELFQWLGLDLEIMDGVSLDLGDRYLRLCEHTIQLSDLKHDFDRWANSTSDLQFDLKKRSDWRKFVREMEERDHQK